MKIVHMKLEDLKPYDKNPRTHSPEQIAQIVNSITEFGFTNPILIDRHGNIIAGHGRYAGAKVLKMPTAPCIVLGNLTEDQTRAYVIADNKIALNAGWDDTLLSEHLEMLNEEGFDIELTGFTLEEIDGLGPEDPEEDEHPINAGMVGIKFTVPVEVRKKINAVIAAIMKRDGIQTEGEALETLCDEWRQYTRQGSSK